LQGDILATVFHVMIAGTQHYLIGGKPFNDFAGVYSSDNREDGRRYAFFSLAALELPAQLGWYPNLLHANDWHTALAIYLLKTKKFDEPLYKEIHSVLSIHNLTFMGAGSEKALDEFGIPESSQEGLPWWARKMPLPLGLQSADRIIPVSDTYAQEIMGPDYGCGLEGFLQDIRDRLVGIVNGLDQNAWNPATDEKLQSRFSVHDLEKRQSNKLALLKEFNLEETLSLPLLVLISRMDRQKGIDLAVEGLLRIQHLPWQAILLGTGDPSLELACRELAAQMPTRVRAAIRFDANLSRRLYAGGDILLMPSRYEPCGLAQMIAMRYGCVPVARATGGLKDTIIDAIDDENGTGFLFGEVSADAFAGTLQRALSVFEFTPRWQAIQRRAMNQDFSWERSAAKYKKIYLELEEG
jgi:starch synthase